MSYNLYQRFVSLFPDAPLQVGTVTEVQMGRVVVSLPSGGLVNLHGSASVGQMIFFRGDVVEGGAPLLDVVEIEI